MSPISKMSHAQLVRRLAAVEEAIAEAVPILWTEKKALEQAIASKTDPQGPYAPHDRVIDAVVALLSNTGRWMTKREISDELKSGGFRAGKTMGAYLIRDSINYHVEKGNLRAEGDHIGLPAWTHSSGLPHGKQQHKR